MKPKLYLETTIPSFHAARRSRNIITAAKQSITRQWWSARRHDFTLFVSDVVVAEAAAGNSEVARRRLRLIAGVEALEITTSAQELAEQLLRQGPLPEKAAVDALHIAVSAVHDIDFLLTWNCKHIANAAMRNKIEEVCRRMGYTAPIMCTPEELMEG